MTLDLAERGKLTSEMVLKSQDSLTAGGRGMWGGEGDKPAGKVEGQEL